MIFFFPNRSNGQLVHQRDASPPATAPQYVYVQYAPSNNTAPRFMDRVPSRSPTPPPAPAPPPPAPPAQAIYFIDPLTHQIWTTTAPAAPPSAPPASSVIKLGNNDPSFPPTPPKDLKPPIISSSSSHHASLAFAKMAASDVAERRSRSPRSPTPQHRPNSVSPTRVQQRFVYSELDAISKLRSLDEKRKKPGSSVTSSAQDGREFEDEEDERRAFSPRAGESGQTRSDSARRSGGERKGRGRDEITTSPVRSPKKIGFPTSAEVIENHHSRVGRFVESNSSVHQQPFHQQQHSLQQGLPLLAASAALASPVAVPAVASRGRSSLNNGGEIRGIHPQQQNHQDSSHRQYNHHPHQRDHYSPPPHNRRDSSVRSPSPALQSPIRTPPRLQQQQHHHRVSSASSLTTSASASLPQNQTVPFSPQRGYSTVSLAVANDEPSSSRGGGRGNGGAPSLHPHHHHLAREEIISTRGSDIDLSAVAPLHGQRLPLNLKADHDQQQQQRLHQSLHRSSSHNREGEGGSTTIPTNAHRSTLVKSEGVAFRERDAPSQALKYHHQQPSLPSSSHRYAESRSPSPPPPASSTSTLKSAYPQQPQQAAVRTQVSFNPATLLQQSGAVRAVGGAAKDNGNGGVYLWQCPVCQKPFMRKSSLVRHEKTHTGERPYGCPHCEKRFIQKSDLNRHIGLHTGQKPFKCSQCDKSYTQSNSLLEHSVRAHQCSEPYPCPHCPQRFMQRHMLTLHLTKGHRLPAPPPINGRAAFVPVSSPSNSPNDGANDNGKRERSPTPTLRVETPLGEEVVVGTFNEEDGESSSPTPNKDLVTQFGGVVFQGHVIASGGGDETPQSAKRARLNFGNDEEKESEGKVEGVMDLRVGSAETKTIGAN